MTAGGGPDDLERALEKGRGKLIRKAERKEKAAEALGRLLEDDETARRAAHMFKRLVAED